MWWGEHNLLHLSSVSWLKLLDISENLLIMVFVIGCRIKPFLVVDCRFGSLLVDVDFE